MAHEITSSDTLFSVREMPWHRLGTILEEPPSSIEDALQKSGLGWQVFQKPVFVEEEISDPTNPGRTQRIFVPLKDAGDVEYRANVRSDNGAVLGVVTQDYKVVGNRDAFEFMDAVLGSDLYFETAGSLQGGKRVWVLARVPEYVEIGGDMTAQYLYVANAHDGSMAVTASPTNVRIVCANTMGAALRQSEYGRAAASTFRFRHTGDLKVKFAEARKVMGLTLNYAEQFKVLGDKMALDPMSTRQLRGSVLPQLFPIDEDSMGKRAVNNRLRAMEAIVDNFHGHGPSGDTRGNSPRTKWSAFNAITEWADWQRRYTKRTNQVQRSFEDQALKSKALDVVLAA